MILKTNENILYLFGTIWSGDGLYFISELARLENQYKDIVIKIHSYGGVVFDGNLMCNAIEASKANIRIEVLGVAASMAGILLLSSKNVSMAENAYIMIHAPAGYTEGTASDHENYAKLLRMMERNLIGKLGKRLNKNPQEINALMQGDHWFDAEDSLKMGLINAIIPSVVESILPIDNAYEIGETEVYNRFGRLLMWPLEPTENTAKNPTLSITNTIPTMKQLLITAFALSALTEQSSDTAVLKAIQDQFTALENEKNTAVNALKAKEDAHIEALLAQAELTDEEKPVFRKIGQSSGEDALSIVLKSKMKEKEQAPNIKGLITGQNSESPQNTKRENWTFDEWQTNDPKGLEKLPQDQFNQLFNEKYKK